MVNPIDNNEPLLKSDNNVFRGIVYKDLEDEAINQERARWTAEELVFTEDTRNWAIIDDGTKRFMKYVLSFSAIADGLVNCNLVERFLQEVTDPSVRRFYSFQSYMEEHVHARAYGMMINAVIMNKKEQDEMFNPNDNIPSIKEKIQWIEKWTNSNKPFGCRLIAFALIEGIFFSSLFASFFWLKQRGSKLPGMIQGNELIAKDEGRHCEFPIKMLKYVLYRMTREEIHCMATEAVNVELEFVKEALPTDLVGINKDTMCEYVKYVADRWLYSIPCVEGFAGPIYNINTCPLEWMELISIPTFTSFFEKEVTNYTDSRLGRTQEDCVYTADADSLFD